MLEDADDGDVGKHALKIRIARQSLEEMLEDIASCPAPTDVPAAAEHLR
jgi:hypothetical protein